jgi:hypothetical protein
MPRTTPIIPLLALSALLGASLNAQATVYQFSAALNAANEVGGSSSTAAGLAVLNYNDMGTVSLADDSYDFAMAVFGLSGGAAPGTAASDYHIHGAANTTQNAPVRISLKNAPFVSFNSGTTLLVGGLNIAAPSIPSTPTNGYPAMSFFDMLQGGLAYVNVHTVANPGGDVRGQLVQVAAFAVPEPSIYAMLLGGLGLVGFVASRRRRQ